jgi:hypothetical protein
MILLGAGLSDGNSRDPRNLPIVLAGKVGGTLATGRHLTHDKGAPIANLCG